MSTLPGKKNDSSERVAPVAEFFTRVARVRGFYATLMASGRIHDVRELGEAHFARSLAERLARPRRGQAAAVEGRDALAPALAGSLFSLLFWWARRGMTIAPAEMDRLFHRLIVGEAAISSEAARTRRFPGAWPFSPAA